MKIPIGELDFLSQLEPFCTVYGAGKRTHCILVSGVGRISCEPHRMGNGTQSIAAAEYKILCKTIQKRIGFDQKPLKRTGAVIRRTMSYPCPCRFFIFQLHTGICTQHMDLIICHLTGIVFYFRHADADTSVITVPELSQFQSSVLRSGINESKCQLGQIAVKIPWTVRVAVAVFRTQIKLCRIYGS